jgi:DNA invertase Pin-like site-specific DNA recombinase
VQALVARNEGRLLEEITEIESGKGNDRPELRRAICRGKVSGARVIIAKLDRLSRNAVGVSIHHTRWHRRYR